MKNSFTLFSHVSLGTVREAELPEMCSSLPHDKNLNEVQFFLLGWTEQKNVYLKFHYCLLKHEVLLEPHTCFLTCLLVCVFSSNLNLVLRTIVYSVVKVLPEEFIRIFRRIAPPAFRRSCI